MPYVVGEDASPAPSDAQAAVPTSVSDAGAESARTAPVGSTRWNVEGRDLVAPQGTEFALALPYDLDADGKSDVLAVVRGVENAASAVVFYAGTGDGSPSIVATGPKMDASCTPSFRLVRASERSAFVEMTATCANRESSRSLFVVRLSREPSVAFDVTVADPKDAGKLTIDVDGADRDHDGIDDVTLALSLEGVEGSTEPSPRVSAKVTFFDRPAGASPSPDEPEASFRAVAAQAVARAGKTKDAPGVPALVRQLRLLYRAICVEGGAPRLTRSGGLGAVSCGTSKALEDANVAEVRATITQKDPVRAVLAAERAQWSPAKKTKAKTTELTTLLEGLGAAVQAKGVRTVDVPISKVTGPHPSWGALAFEPSGKLLVRTDAKVVRVDPSTFEREDTEIGPWPLQVLSPDGKSRWLEAYATCGGSFLRATFVPTGGDGDVTEVPLPVAVPLGTRCTSARGESSSAAPLAWGPRGLWAVVAGQPVLVASDGKSASSSSEASSDAPVSLGAPRSPNGKILVLSSADGVLLRSDRVLRYRGVLLEPYDKLRGCVVNDDGTKLACERDGKVVVADF